LYSVCRECKMYVLCLLLLSLLDIEKTIGDDVSSTLSTWSGARDTAEPMCACPENNKSILVENAKKMTEMTQNKTIINKIKHRVTHSNDAIWASTCLSFIFVLIVIGLLQTKMWKDQTFLSYPESQPVKYEQHNREAEISVKHLLRSQGRKLLKYFNKKRKRKQTPEFKMETFLSGSGDAVDSSYKNMIESSDGDSDGSSSDDIVFSINRKTGEWTRENVARNHLQHHHHRDIRDTRHVSNVSVSSSESESESAPLISI